MTQLKVEKYGLGYAIFYYEDDVARHIVNTGYSKADLEAEVEEILA